MKFEIKNCNNIEKGSVLIKRNELNIKFALNGTGKSTIAKAITWMNEPDNLINLKSFESNKSPEATINTTLKKVVTFNENFVNNIVFKGNDVIENAFEVFIKTPTYDLKRQKVDDLLKSLKEELFINDDLKKLHTSLTEIKDKINFNVDTKKIAVRGVYSSIINWNNKIPVELEKYNVFLNENYKIEWVDWKTKGLIFDDKGKCPFCAEIFKDNYYLEKTIFSNTYKKALIKNITDFLTIIETGKNFMLEEKHKMLLERIKENRKQEELDAFFIQFMAQVNYLFESITKIQEFDSYHIEKEEIDILDNKIQELKINLSCAEYFNSLTTQSIVKKINAKVDILLGKVNELKSEIGALNNLIAKTMKNSMEDINNFLCISGLNYTFDIFKEKNEKTSKAILKYVKKDASKIEVENISKHLSWGEKNSFSLILFMYYAISQDADLIILDDPISSFDDNKKYAINYRLFEKRRDNLSLFNKTVLFLTHDFEPIIDFGKIGKPAHKHNIYFMKNEKGILTESEIIKKDIKTVLDIYYRHSTNANLNIVIRVSSLRKYIELINVNDREEINLAYNILSSIIHNRTLSQKKSDGSFINLTKKEITKGTEYIQNYISNFNCADIKKQLNATNLIQSFKNESNNYIKVLIFRLYVKITNDRARLNKTILKFLDESYHIENDYIFSLDLLKYNLIPTFIIDELSKYMETLEN